MKRKILAAAALCLLIPYVITLFAAGKQSREDSGQKPESGRTVLCQGESGGQMDLEQYALAMAAAQIPAEYEKEAVKAQIILARTYLYKKLSGRSLMDEAELGTEAWKETKRAEVWGSAAKVYEEKFQEALSETEGMVLTCNGTLIDSVFHRRSAGKTRDGGENFPYLKSVDSSWDLTEAENRSAQIQGTGGDGSVQTGAAGVSGMVQTGTADEGASGSVLWLSAAELAKKLGTIRGKEIPDQLAPELQITGRDEAGYVTGAVLGTETYSGDEIAEALSLSSPAFSISRSGNQLRITAKGEGHGYGMSQSGAQYLAKTGKTAEEILLYYFQNIAIEIQPKAGS